jgi:hypothetical protein
VYQSAKGRESRQPNGAMQLVMELDEVVCADVFHRPGTCAALMGLPLGAEAAGRNDGLLDQSL